MHTSFTGGFTYHGLHYIGDWANIAQGDNFLSLVARSRAYKSSTRLALLANWGSRGRSNYGDTRAEWHLPQPAPQRTAANGRQQAAVLDLLNQILSAPTR
jgi:hypothetical protein